MKFVVAQETKVLGTKMAKNLEVIEATTLNEAKEIYMTKFPKATNVYGYQKDEETTTTNNEEEETMKYEERKAIAKEAYEAGKIAQDVMGQIMLNNLSDEIIEREHEDGSLSDEIYNALMNNEKEETTMKTTNHVTLSLIDGTVRFELEGVTYKYNQDTERYSKTTADGKTKRIGKAEYDAAFAAYSQQVLDNAEAAQAELDEEPCFVDPVADLYTPAVIDENGCVDCRECNVRECVHRNCMRRNPKNVGGLGECPRLDAIPQSEDVDPNDPENAYPDEAQDPELDQIMDETGLEASDAELERNIRNEQKKAARKPRKSKDIAYEGHGKTLTAKQVDFILHLSDSCFWENGLESALWTDVLCDEIKGQFAGKPMTVGAMISTLCEKGLAERAKDKINNRTATYMVLTGLGKEIAKELGLE